MSDDRRSILDWAYAFAGDPTSSRTRGYAITEFLQEEGLEPHHAVLDLGCGPLTTGVPLIDYLEPGRYVGCDPAGWQVEAALDAYPHLLDKQPRFLWRTDFEATSDGPYDYVVSHSVLSHVAHWQLEQALLNVRKAVNEGAVWLASYRRDQHDSFDREWVYPGVSFFRIETLKVLGFHAGWHVEQADEYQRRLSEVCRNDVHEWIRLKAVPSAADQNALRLDDEAWREERREILEVATAEHQRRQEKRLKVLRAREAEAARKAAGE